MVFMLPAAGGHYSGDSEQSGKSGDSGQSGG